MPIASKLHTVILLGSSDPADGWMLVNATKLAWAMADADGHSHFLAPQPLTHYEGSTAEGYILGEAEADRLLIPHPPRVQVHRDPAALKSNFLQRVRAVSSHMAPVDTLFIAFSSHGRYTDGAVVIGLVDDPSSSVYLSIDEMKQSLRYKPKSSRVFLWASACYSGFWLEEANTPWEVLAASRRDQQTQCFPTSPSYEHRGGLHTLAAFTVHGRDAGIQYPYAQAPVPHSFEQARPPSPLDHTHRRLPDLAASSTELMMEFRGNRVRQQACSSQSQHGLPFPAFTSASLARLRLVPHQPVDPSQTNLLYIRTESAATGVQEAMRRISIKQEPSNEHFIALTSSFTNAWSRNLLPTTPTMVKISRWVRQFDTTKADPLVDVALLTHVLAYQENIFFLSNCMELAGVWTPCNDPPGAEVDLRSLLNEDDDTPDVTDLWSVLGTHHTFPGNGSRSWTFDWNTPVVDTLLGSWYRAGRPHFKTEQLRDARGKVLHWLRWVLEKESDAQCACGLHPLLTAAEYAHHLQKRREEELKEHLLATLPSPPSHLPSSPSLSASDLTSILDSVGITSPRRAAVLSSSRTFP
ncbi:hypothetical protein B0H16DRAFT_1488271 [Mycena metata]|uniref:Uncharacterized protein n=1 Tax=Mycena metata TaxID=1033252 RepID=A0AAD7KIU4_9AGAR|nr:hypothetical protein B0H16DRAFT_1488271 [Mycena metata]